LLPDARGFDRESQRRLCSSRDSRIGIDGQWRHAVCARRGAQGGKKKSVVLLQSG